MWKELKPRKLAIIPDDIPHRGWETKSNRTFCVDMICSLSWVEEKLDAQTPPGNTCTNIHDTIPPNDTHDDEWVTFTFS